MAAVAVALAATSGAPSGTGTAQALLPTGTPSPAPSTRAATPAPSPTQVISTPTVAHPVRKRRPPGPRILSTGSCEASYYEGVPTSGGGTLTAANRTLPFGTQVKVINEDNGESVTVTITDRGPFVTGRCLDLSTSAMSDIDGMGSGVVPVKYEVLGS
jgi:rare lipoprotein A